MFIIQMFRQEARGPYDGMTEDWEAFQNDPFEGIEIIGFCDTEEGVNEVIDEFQAKFPKAKFHYEEARDVMFLLPGELEEVELEESEQKDS